MIDFKVHGFEELDRALREFPTKVVQGVSDRAARAGANVVLQATRENYDRLATGTKAALSGVAVPGRSTPFSLTEPTHAQSGLTRKRIKITKRHYSGGSQYSVGISRYGMFIELGTRAHIIKARKKKMLAFIKSLNISDTDVSAEFAFKQEVSHPHVPAKPFLRPAFYNNIDKVIEEMRKVLAGWIDTEYYSGYAKQGTYAEGFG